MCSYRLPANIVTGFAIEISVLKGRLGWGVGSCHPRGQTKIKLKTGDLLIQSHLR